MAKLSALVIPAVIDTSGIDKGVNSIRNKLSRVRGQGGGNSGGGNGFSSGITPYGGHMPYGGGSAVGTAMAAAFGANAASRMKETTSVGGYNLRNIPQPSLAKKFAAKHGYKYAGTFDASGRSASSTSDAYDAAFYRYVRSSTRADFAEREYPDTPYAAKTAAMNIRRMREFEGNLSGKPSTWRIGEKNKERAREMVTKVLGFNPSKLGMLSKLGLGGAAYSFLSGMGSQNMMGRMGDYQRFEGTGYYAPMRGFMRDYYKNTSMGVAQSFWRGQRGATGGTSSFFERLYTGLGDIPGAAAETAGSALSFGGGDSPEQRQARSAYYQERYGGTPMTMGGPIAVGMYKFFKRLFS